jgi:hypothetical protein
MATAGRSIQLELAAPGTPFSVKTSVQVQDRVWRAGRCAQHATDAAARERDLRGRQFARHKEHRNERRSRR